MVKWTEAVRLTAGREFGEIWYFPTKTGAVSESEIGRSYLLFTSPTLTATLSKRAGVVIYQ
ncbi:hypothetical protein B0T13DRAFT_476254 [Neurospora crassa]|nr:hypothetical protein B0T13DRAFT_476254 [Neurospora crassa]